MNRVSLAVLFEEDRRGAFAVAAAARLSITCPDLGAKHGLQRATGG